MLSTPEIEATIGRLYLTILDRDKTIAALEAERQPPQPIPAPFPQLASTREG